MIAALATAEAWRARASDYGELAKPSITLMVALTALAGFGMAPHDGATLYSALTSVIGIALCCAASNALNQVLERDTDGLMARTRNRPLPAGRMDAWEALVFAIALAAGGVTLLALFANALSALLAACTIAAYAFAYTPLKRASSLALFVGAVPGAMPPLLGWVSATGSLSPSAFALFAILFVWQIPHFLAIDWLHREDYARAGLKTTAVCDPTGTSTAWRAVAGCLALLPLGVSPFVLHLAGPVYAGSAILLGLAYLASSITLARNRTRQSARRLLLASVAYLPLLLLILALDAA